MRIFRQHGVIKLGNQTSKIKAQYKFGSTYLIKITVILTEAYVDITDLFLAFDIAHLQWLTATLILASN
jgi:hypothetical protein